MNVFINEVNYFSGTFSRCYHCMYCVFNRKIFFVVVVTLNLFNIIYQ